MNHVTISKISSILGQSSLRSGLIFFLRVIIFKAPLLIFIWRCLLKSWWSNWHVYWSMTLKSSTVGYLSKSCFQCTLQLSRKNIKYSCDQLTFRITITLAAVALIQISFLNAGSKQKIKMNTWNTMASSYKSQVYSKHGNTTLLLFEPWSLVLYLHVLVKAKYFLII